MANPQTNAHAAVSVCSTAQNNDLTEATAAALTWVLVGNVGKIGEHEQKVDATAARVISRSADLEPPQNQPAG